MAIQHTRRHFIKTFSMTGMALAISSNKYDFNRYNPRLSFSTLGCPDWNFDKILSFAAINGYNGIELRGLQRQLDLTKCPEFSSKENILTTRKKIQEKKLKVVSLDASTALHHADASVRKNNIDEAKSFIRLAEELDCRYVRVFPNNLPKDQQKDVTIELIVKGLIELGNFAKEYGVTVLMETHGDLVHSADIEKIMHMVEHPNVGLVWDIVNMWSETKEPPAQVYVKLRKYIQHTHIKDLKMDEGKKQYVLLGKGNTPIFEAIDLLANDNYKGYFSFEWEKLWHPEIEEPEVAISDYSKVMCQHFKNK